MGSSWATTWLPGDDDFALRLAERIGNADIESLVVQAFEPQSQFSGGSLRWGVCDRPWRRGSPLLPTKVRPGCSPACLKSLTFASLCCGAYMSYVWQFTQCCGLRVKQ